MNAEDFKRKWTLQEFKNKVWERIGKSFDTVGCTEIKNSKYILAQFCNHWCEPTPGHRKMKWQTNKTFCITMRLATWVGRQKNEYHPEWWKEKKPMAPVKWLPTNKSPEAIEESRRIKERYEKEKANRELKVPYKPKTITRMKLDEVKRQEELKKQSEQKFTDYE